MSSENSDLGGFKSFHIVETTSGFPNFKKVFLQLPNGACFSGTIREQLTTGDNTSNIIGYKVNENYGAFMLMSVTEVRQYKISGGTIIFVGNYLTNSDLNVSTINGSVKTTNDWTTNFARAKKSGCAVALKIDATAKTASNGWIVVASGLPAAAADDFFYQGYDDGHGAYKIKIDTSGNLSLSNRSGKVATYVDTVISYVAR